MCEGVGEDSGHGVDHLDIRVGSCNYLNVFVCHACELRWRIKKVISTGLCSPCRRITILGTGSDREGSTH